LPFCWPHRNGSAHRDREAVTGYDHAFADNAALSPLPVKGSSEEQEMPIHCVDLDVHSSLRNDYEINVSQDSFRKYRLRKGRAEWRSHDRSILIDGFGDGDGRI
jgi:hypothetical protein